MEEKSCCDGSLSPNGKRRLLRLGEVFGDEPLYFENVSCTVESARNFVPTRSRPLAEFASVVNCEYGWYKQ